MEEPRRILNGRFFRVLYDSPAQLMQVVRTTAVFATIEEMEPTFEQLVEALDRGGRGGPLLVDLRAARGRNDEPFEAVMRGYRPRILAGFGPVGIFVRSVVGELQVQRHLREDGTQRVVSSDLKIILETLGLAEVPACLSELAEGSA